jgi:hypothetical protein
MTKKAILELIQQRCKGIDETGQFSPLYLQGYCDQVWQEFVAGMNKSQYVDKSFYSKEYVIASIDGDSTDGYYNDLPETIINLPRTGSGVASIRLPGSFSNYLSPVTEDDYKHMQSQEVYRQADDIVFYLSYDRIFYAGAITGTIASNGVVTRLIIPFSKYNMNEELPLPVMMEIQFIDAVVERVIGTPSPDLYNNNSDE